MAFGFISNNNNDIFGSRAQKFFDHGATPGMIENARKNYGHEGVKETVHDAGKLLRAEEKRSGVSIHDRFEPSQSTDEPMSHSKMAAAMAGMRNA